MPKTVGSKLPITTIQGEMGKYIVTARRRGNKWFIVGINNWDAREITLDVEAITGKTGNAVVFQDGADAEMNGIDYAKRNCRISKGDNVVIHMAPSGGFALSL